MKTKIKMAAFIPVAAFIVMNACTKEDETPKPEVNLTELGYENSKAGYAGSDLHIDADIVAEGRIERVAIEIHPEGGHDKSAAIILHEGEWEVDTAYAKFSGLRNTDFHEHIDIPVDVEPGHYHFHLVVTDMLGQQTTVEEELEIRIPDDSVAPEVTIATAPSDDQVFSKGQTISITGSVTDNKALGGLYIGLVREDQNLTDAGINATNTITILHTHSFGSIQSHSFSAGIIVGAAKDNNITPKDISGTMAWQSARYYIVVKCTDAFGGNWAYSERYPVIINY